MEEIKKQEILAKLASDENYYGEYGRQFLSNSDIGTLINNPRGFLEPREDSINLMYGRAFHELIMFGETQYSNFVDASTRTTKIYKEASEEAGGLLFLKKEWEDLNLLVDTAMKNKIVSDVLNNKSNSYEIPNLGNLGNDDVTWKCKADILSDEYIIDIKTSSFYWGV
jgi:hypothetical protein